MTNFTKSLAVVLLGGIAALGLSGMPVHADGPQFNIFPISYTGELNTDLPLLDGRNTSRGESWSFSQSDHDAGIQASAGEIIEFSIYYHNGTPDTDLNIAYNTLTKAFASPPAGTPSSNFIVSATVSASNAATVASSDAGRGGNMQIFVQGNQPLNLSLVPGSVILHRDRGVFPQPLPQSLPDSILGGGVNIGSVRGCFQYHGFVNFKMQLSQALQGDLSVQKEVRNVSANSGFSDTVISAEPGQTVEYRIAVSAGNALVPDVFVSDGLDSRLTLTGPVILDGFVFGQAPNLFTPGGMSIGHVNPGTVREIKFQATIPQASSLPTGTTLLMNDVNVFNAQKFAVDWADVSVSVSPQPVSQIDLDKQVGISSFAQEIDAQPGQRVSFRLIITPLASNTPLTGVIVRDVLPAKLSFVPGSFNVDGFTFSEGGFFGSGYTLGTLYPGDQIVITFQADAAGSGNFPANSCENLTNSATVIADGNLFDTDTAVVRVCGITPTKQPGSPGPRPN